MSTEEEITTIKKLIETIDLKFTSGNEIPVKRASITHEEWVKIKSELFSYNNIRKKVIFRAK